jgi:gliding motility-associated-like protein
MKAAKKILFSLIFLCSCFASFANHITGGEMYYTYAGRSGSNYVYQVTLKLYRDCNAPPNSAPLDPEAAIGVYNSSGSLVWNGRIPMSRPIQILSLGSPGPCITNPPIVCYQVGYYEFTLTLPASVNGYVVTFQRCCRINGINNILAPSSSSGATYFAEIPGTGIVASGPENNSAQFIGSDTVIVCSNSPIYYSFGAVDADKQTFGDSLVYSFCDAFLGGGQGSGAGGSNTPVPDPPSPPPYTPIPYQFPFSGSQPLGSGVSINPQTGLITGIAPEEGIYVVTVCVREYREGKLIATQRKDLQIKITNCITAAAVLKPEYITCDGYTLSFKNETPPSNLIKTYYWDFGLTERFDDTSVLATPTFTFPDTGIYTITLITNKNGECSDTATAFAKVFPGFFPEFDFAGICVNKPTQFTDRTQTAYGVVNSWRWKFDGTGSGDTSRLQNPTFTYNQVGNKNVELIVGNSKGCIDTIQKVVTVIDKPPISVAFKDTLICNGDALQLEAIGNGNFSWTPGIAITNANTATPTVSPSATTTYSVQLDDNGCINNDTVRVRVVNFVTLQVMPDTTICLTDSVQLRVTTDALRVQWSPANAFNNDKILNPKVKPTATTTYDVTGFIGGCSTTGSVNVSTVPYPVVNAGPDTTVCFGTSAFLNGSTNGTTFSWAPVNSLSSSSTLSPVASPLTTTNYILTAVSPASGCPKNSKDTVRVTVLPKINAFAGNDTAIVVGQPLQFNGSGGVRYQWIPATNLSNATIPNPVATYTGSFDSIRYQLLVYNEADCVDSAYITVKVFRTNPQVFVPSAFTPNGDGINDIIRPIAVGVTQIQYFRVYNRWGQLIFSTTQNGQGWNGKINGKDQGTGVYVWIVKAVDFTGKEIIEKGTVTLIR